MYKEVPFPVQGGASVFPPGQTPYFHAHHSQADVLEG